MPEHSVSYRVTGIQGELAASGYRLPGAERRGNRHGVLVGLLPDVALMKMLTFSALISLG